MSFIIVKFFFFYQRYICGDLALCGEYGKNNGVGSFFNVYVYISLQCMTYVFDIRQDRRAKRKSKKKSLFFFTGDFPSDSGLMGK